MKKVLVTTSIEDTWPDDAHLVFLGEWCKKYSRRHFFSGKSHETLPYHWEDRDKFKKDSVYLRELHELLLQKLRIVLNDHHNTNHSLRYWRIIIGPWLVIFVPAIFDRWENLRNAMSFRDYDSVILNKNLASDLIRPDYLSSAICLQDDSWNHSIYSDIIEKEYENFGSKFYTHIRSYNSKKKIKATFLSKLTNTLDNIFSKINPKYSIAFIGSYLKPYTRIRLALKFGQFPRSYSFFEKETPQTRSFTQFRHTDIGLKTKNPFENYISKNILQLMPTSYLECFDDIQDIANRIPDKVRLVFTANAHFSNDIFKVWCAHQIEKKGTKLLIGSHGGALPSEFSSFVDHEESAADKRIVWHTPITKKQIRLPANKYVGVKNNSHDKEDKVTLIGLDLGKYSYGMQSGPASSLMLSDLEQKNKFVLCLVQRFKRKIGLYPAVTEAWEAKSRINKFVDKEQIDTYSNYDEALQKSKLIICSYPQTTLSDALFSRTPFVLLYTEKYWTFPSHFDSLIGELKRAKIFFSDPILAAEHVNLIWDDPEEWWSSPDVQKAKQYLQDECLLVSKNGIGEWYKFLSAELES
ncbi:LIC12162 family protein [Gammaproteobacteria bacterium]|nr:LIC12162 family protein [Gammaproteobacteria bacterium]